MMNINKEMKSLSEYIIDIQTPNDILSMHFKEEFDFDIKTTALMACFTTIPPRSTIREK